MQRPNILAALLACLAGTAASQTDYAWVQLAEGPRAIVRAITSSASCADIAPAGLPMQERDDSAMAEMADLTVCEASVSLSDKKTVMVGPTQLTIPAATAPSRILLLGDTGCRDAPAGSQDCTSGWFFPQIASAAAALEPDLVIHVGDYTYRDNCGRDVEGCDPNPDPKVRRLRDWSVWEDDFFAPAAPLLAAAPWVIVRGNHEDCAPQDERGWVGWSTFFSTVGLVTDLAVCERQTYHVDEMIRFDAGAFPALNIYLLNASRATTTRLVDFSKVTNTPETWITTHVPFWSEYGRFRDPRDSHYRAWPKASLVLSGHDHLFQIYKVADDNGERAPVQVIQGASGTSLQSARTPPGKGGLQYVYDADFSFNMLERTPPGPTRMTLCGFSRGSGDVSALQTWVIEQMPSGPTFGTAPTISVTACVPPG